MENQLASASASPLLTRLAFVFAVVFFLLNRGTKNKRDVLQASFHWVATRLEGTLDPARWPTPPRIRFAAGGRSAVLEYVTRESTQGATRVSVDLRGCSPGSVQICREGFASSLLRKLGVKDVDVGDPAFDADYQVRGNPASAVRRIFDPSRRARVIELIRRLEAFPDPVLDVTREALTVRVGGYLSADGDLLTLARSAQGLAEVLLALDPGEAVFWLESAPGPGQCQVCGSELLSELVRCTRCKTPHHQECWDYAGRCSTFACGETRGI